MPTTHTVTTTGLRGAVELSFTPEAPDDVVDRVRSYLDDRGVDVRTLPVGHTVAEITVYEDRIEIDPGPAIAGLVPQQPPDDSGTSGGRDRPPRGQTPDPGQATLSGDDGPPAPAGTEQSTLGGADSDTRAGSGRSGQPPTEQRESGQLSLQSAGETRRQTLGAFEDADDGQDEDPDDTPTETPISGDTVGIPGWGDLPPEINGWRYRGPGEEGRSPDGRTPRYIGANDEVVVVDASLGQGIMGQDRVTAAYYTPLSDDYTDGFEIVDLPASQQNRAREDLIDWFRSNPPGTYTDPRIERAALDPPTGWSLASVRLREQTHQYTWTQDDPPGLESRRITVSGHPNGASWTSEVVESGRKRTTLENHPEWWTPVENTATTSEQGMVREALERMQEANGLTADDVPFETRRFDISPSSSRSKEFGTRPFTYVVRTPLPRVDDQFETLAADDPYVDAGELREALARLNDMFPDTDPDEVYDPVQGFGEGGRQEYPAQVVMPSPDTYELDLDPWLEELAEETTGVDATDAPQGIGDWTLDHDYDNHIEYRLAGAAEGLDVDAPIATTVLTAFASGTPETWRVTVQFFETDDVDDADPVRTSVYRTVAPSDLPNDTGGERVLGDDSASEQLRQAAINDLVAYMTDHQTPVDAGAGSERRANRTLTLREMLDEHGLEALINAAGEQPTATDLTDAEVERIRTRIREGDSRIRVPLRARKNAFGSIDLITPDAVPSYITGDFMYENELDTDKIDIDELPAAETVEIGDLIIRLSTTGEGVTGDTLELDPEYRVGTGFESF